MSYKFFLAALLIVTSIVFGDEGKEIARSDSYQSHRSRYQKQQGIDELLFVLHAKDGHLASDLYANEYVLTLYHVDKNVTYFTDRPARKAGKISLEKFLRSWDLGSDSFRKDNPNAGLVTFLDFKKKGQEQFSDVPITLSNPQYDKKNNRLIFNVQILEKQETIPTGDLGETTLFIDSPDLTHLGGRG